MSPRLSFFWKIRRTATIVIILLASACQPATPQVAQQVTPPLVPVTGEYIGTITRQFDQVEQGASADVLQPVKGTNPLLEGDILKISEGGEGLLDFDDKLVIRLFSDTQVGLVSASAPGTPLGVRMFLERGGFTGKLNEGEGQAVFETPGGAKITVLGTQFFVVYNPLQQMTTIGNYDGQVQLETSAGIITLQAGNYVDWADGQVPEQQAPIPITIEQFEQESREGRSPHAAVERLVTAPLAATDTAFPILTPTTTFQPDTPTITPALVVTAASPNPLQAPTITFSPPSPTPANTLLPSPTSTDTPHPQPPTNTPTPPLPPADTPSPQPPTSTPTPPPPPTDTPSPQPPTNTPTPPPPPTAPPSPTPVPTDTPPLPPTDTLLPPPPTTTPVVVPNFSG